MAGNVSVYSPEDGGRRFLPNICICVPKNTVPSPKSLTVASAV